MQRDAAETNRLLAWRATHRLACIGALALIAWGCANLDAQRLREAEQLERSGALEAAALRYEALANDGDDETLRRLGARGQLRLRRILTSSPSDACPTPPLRREPPRLDRHVSPPPLPACWSSLIDALDQRQARGEDPDGSGALEAARHLLDHGHAEDALERARALEPPQITSPQTPRTSPPPQLTSDRVTIQEARALQLRALERLGSWPRLHMQLRDWQSRGALESDPRLSALASTHSQTLCDALELRGHWLDAADCLETMSPQWTEPARLDALERVAAIRLSIDRTPRWREVMHAQLLTLRQAPGLDPRQQQRLCEVTRWIRGPTEAVACLEALIDARQNALAAETPLVVLEARLERARLLRQQGLPGAGLEEALEAVERRLESPAIARWATQINDAQRGRLEAIEVEVHRLRVVHQMDRLINPLTLASKPDEQTLRAHLQIELMRLHEVVDALDRLARAPQRAELLANAGFALHDAGLRLFKWAVPRHLTPQTQVGLEALIADVSQGLERAARRRYVAATREARRGQRRWLPWVQRGLFELKQQDIPPPDPEELIWRWSAAPWLTTPTALREGALRESTPKTMRRLMANALDPHLNAVAQISALEAMLEPHPHPAQLHHQIAAIAFTQGRADAARQSLEQAVKADPSASFARLDLAVALLESGRAAEGAQHLALLTRGVQPAEIQARAHYNLGLHLYQQEHPALGAILARWRHPRTLAPDFPALSAFLRGAETRCLDPANATSEPLTARWRGDAIVDLEPIARAQAQSHLEVARRHFYQASAQLPMRSTAQIALIQRDQGLAGLARHTCARALALGQGVTPAAEALHACALVSVAHGELDVAIERLEQALRITPDAPAARLTLGRVARWLGDVNLAREVLTHPSLEGRELATLERALVEWSAGRYRRAREHFDRLSEHIDSRYYDMLFRVTRGTREQGHHAIRRLKAQKDALSTRRLANVRCFLKEVNSGGP